MSPNENPESTMNDRWIKLPEVQELTTYSRSSIYRLISEGTFPPPIQLSSRCVVWRLSTVEKWMQNIESANHP